MTRGGVRRFRGSPDTDHREILSNCERLLRERGLLRDEPFDLDRFILRIETSRGRRIHLTPVEIPADSQATVCGVCISTARADYVFYAHTFSPAHRMHNAVHELCHIALDHGSVAPLTGPMPATAGTRSTKHPASWLPGPGASYSERAEREAETAAGILLSQVRFEQPGHHPPALPFPVAALRLSEAFD